MMAAWCHWGVDLICVPLYGASASVIVEWAVGGV